MPIGVVSDEDFEKEFGNKQPENEPPLNPAKVIDKPTRGRQEGTTDVPDSLRQIIGEEALLNGRQAALSLAKDFGVSASSASAYAVGATSTTTYHQPSKSILSHINKSRERAVKKASRTLNAALGSISQDKLDYADAKDLSVIAKNMSAIIKDLEPQQVEDASGTRAPQFVIFAPSFRSESSFEVIDVKE